MLFFEEQNRSIVSNRTGEFERDKSRKRGRKKRQKAKDEEEYRGIIFGFGFCFLKRMGRSAFFGNGLVKSEILLYGKKYVPKMAEKHIQLRRLSEGCTLSPLAF